MLAREGLHGATRPGVPQLVNADSKIEGAVRAITGSCLCGAVRVRAERVAGAMVLCHCSQCRKPAGAPFQAVLPVARADCEIADPEGLLRAFRASPGKARWFCGRCGAPVYSERDGADTLRLRAGILDQPCPLVPEAHIHAADAAPWHRITDALPRYPGVEPGRGGTGQRPS